MLQPRQLGVRKHLPVVDIAGAESHAQMSVRLYMQGPLASQDFWTTRPGRARRDLFRLAIGNRHGSGRPLASVITGGTGALAGLRANLEVSSDADFVVFTWEGPYHFAP